MIAQKYFFLGVVFYSASFAYANEANPILVSSDKATIRKFDLDAEMQRIPEADRTTVLSSRQRLGQLVDNILTTKVLAREAEKVGIDKNPALQAEFDLAREKILTRAYMEKFVRDLKLPDFTARAREMYLAEPEKYTPPDRLRVAHILVDTRSRSADAALERIKEVRAKLDAGANFSEIAKEYSDDPSVKKNGGLLAMTNVKDYDETFSRVALKLKPGQLSEPVRTPFGYHIIRLDEYVAGKLYPFDLVKNEIIEQLKSQYIDTQKKNHVASLQQDPSIKINEAAMDAQLPNFDLLRTPLPK